MYARLRPLAPLAAAAALLLAACGEESDPLAPQDQVRAFADATPVGAMAGLMELDVNAPGLVQRGLTGYLKLGGIDGESTDAGHEGEIDVYGLEWTTRMEFGVDPTSGQTVARTRMDDLVLVKPVDASSPALAEALRNDTELGTAVLAVRSPPSGDPATAGGEHEVEYDIRAAKLVDTQPGLEVNGIPTEEVTLTFATVGWTLPGQAPAPGTAAAVTPIDALTDDLGLDLDAPGPDPVPAAAYMKFQGVDGDSGERSGSSDVPAFQWSSVVEVQAGNPGTARLRMGELTVWKAVDAASPALRDAAAAGTLLDDVELALDLDPSNVPSDDRVVTLFNVTVTAFVPGDAGTGTPDEVTLAFTRVEW